MGQNNKNDTIREHINTQLSFKAHHVYGRIFFTYVVLVSPKEKKNYEIFRNSAYSIWSYQWKI